MRLTIPEAEALIAGGFAGYAAPATCAAIASALVAAERDGQKGHGFSRFDSYLGQAKSGKADGFAEPVVSQQGALVSIDAKGGFAYPAVELALSALPELAQAHGIATAQIFNSHHAGQLGAHVERLAEAGVLALMFANTPQAMAPWGGNKALFGTNPIAFAAPRDGQPPLVIDLSLSKVARGKIMAAKQKGEAIPEGWALDADGNPTSDPEAALAGTMIPMGDAKGAALALIVEVLAATLTGANHSNQASSFFTADGPSPSVGQLIICLKPSAGFAQRLELLLDDLTDQPGARIPGTSRLAKRETATVEMDDALYERLKQS